MFIFVIFSLSYKAPFYVILKLTIPLVSEEHPRQGWCRPLACLQLALTPVWIVWAIGCNARVSTFIYNILIYNLALNRW